MRDLDQEGLALIEEFDVEVSSRSQAILRDAEYTVKNIENSLQHVLSSISPWVRAMPLKTLLLVYDGDLDRAFASIASRSPLRSPMRRPACHTPVDGVPVAEPLRQQAATATPRTPTKSPNENRCVNVRSAIKAPTKSPRTLTRTPTKASLASPRRVQKTPQKK
jgi:hypothetical protein